MLARPSGHPLGGPMHVDGAYNWFRKDFPAYTTIIATPKLGFKRSSDSSIADISWKNRLPFIKKLIKKSKTYHQMLEHLDVITAIIQHLLC